MNDEYKAVYGQADALRYKFHDSVDDPNNPSAANLYSGINQLAEDVEMQKNPHELEDLAKRLAEEAREVSNQQVHIMDPRHLEDIREELEDIRNEVRKFSNY